MARLRARRDPCRSARVRTASPARAMARAETSETSPPCLVAELSESCSPLRGGHRGDPRPPPRHQLPTGARGPPGLIQPISQRNSQRISQRISYERASPREPFTEVGEMTPRAVGGRTRDSTRSRPRNRRLKVHLERVRLQRIASSLTQHDREICSDLPEHRVLTHNQVLRCRPQGASVDASMGASVDASVAAP